MNKDTMNKNIVFNEPGDIKYIVGSEDVDFNPDGQSVNKLKVPYYGSGAMGVTKPEHVFELKSSEESNVKFKVLGFEQPVFEKDRNIYNNGGIPIDTGEPIFDNELEIKDYGDLSPGITSPDFLLRTDPTKAYIEDAFKEKQQQKRNKVALIAMKGILSGDHTTLQCEADGAKPVRYDFEKIVRKSFELADEFLKQAEK